MSLGMAEHAALLEAEREAEREATRALDMERAAASFRRCTADALRMNEQYYDGYTGAWGTLSPQEMRAIVTAELHRRGMGRADLEHECPT